MSGLSLIMKGKGFKVQGSDIAINKNIESCLLYTSPSPRDRQNLVCRLLLEKKKKNQYLKSRWYKLNNISMFEVSISIKHDNHRRVILFTR